MASLIWEPIGYIGSQVKLRVKMDDDTSMYGNEDGMSFMAAINGTSGLIPSFKEFRWSLGFGHLNYNYDDFWVPASTYEQINVNYNEEFGSLGNGYGVVKSSSNHLLPYNFYVTHHPFQAGLTIGTYGDRAVKCSNWYWEQYEMSAIVELPLSFASEHAIDSYWGDTIHASGGVNIGSGLGPFYERVFGITNTDDLFGDAPFANFGFPEYRNIPSGAVENYNILISTVLHLSNANGTFLNIECADSEAIDNSVVLYGGNSIRYAYAPVHFTTSVYDFTPNFIDINSPNYVNEGESAAFQIEIDPRDYRGTMKVYLLDSTSVDTINQEIGTDLEEFYGLIQDDVVAQYGELQFLDSENSHIKTIQVEGNNIIEVPISYTGSNVSAGQRDTFSIFVKSDQPNFNSYQSDLYDAEYQWGIVPIQDKYIYTDNMRIDVLDTDQEFVEDYDPSDTLITRPSDIIHHLLCEEMGFDKNKIDMPSKIESRVNNDGLNLAFSINEEIEGKRLIKEISQSFKSIPSLSNDVLKFINIKSTYNGDENIFTIKSDDVLKYSFSRTPLEDVKTKVNVRYKKDYGMNTYLESSEVKVSNYSYFITGKYGEIQDAGYSNYYGFKSTGSEINHVDTFLEVKNDYIRDYSSASKLSYYLLQWHKNQHNIVSLTLPLNYYGFEVGDLIDFDKMIEGRKLYGENYVLSDIDENGAYKDMPIRCGQHILPLFMITETSKNLQSISIKAIQLHHQSGSELIWKNAAYNIYQGNVLDYDIVAEDVEVPSAGEPGSGDFNNDGFTDILDVVRMVNIVISGNVPDDDVLIGDVNQDGQLNVLDVITIVNRIVNG
jgi:hypothetical protein|tara:strand:+ start:2066 stop:4558 length:2493 start_codon:yes stop_codon:yes gene_type:complete